MKIALYPFDNSMAETVWKIGFKSVCPEWSKWDAPYFDEYTSFNSLESFINSKDWKFLLSSSRSAILIDGNPIGMVSRYWVSEKTRWMEIGIVIYDQNYWGHGYASQALSIWTKRTFEQYPELEHLGLTTWSGNKRMIRLAEKLGFIKEAQIRKVRFWNGVYFDSIKYGILRDECKLYNS